MSRHRVRRTWRRGLVALGAALLVVAAVAGTAAVVAFGVGRTVLPSSSLTIPPSPSSSTSSPPAWAPGCPDGFVRYHGSSDPSLACVRPTTPTR